MILRVVAAVTCVLTLALVFQAPAVQAQDELTQRATWKLPTTAVVRAQLDDYLAPKALDESTRFKIDALWPDEAQPLDGTELLERLTDSLAVVEPQAAAVVTACRSSRSLLPTTQFSALSDQSLPPLVRDNLQLLLARTLSQQNYVDESLELLANLTTDHVADPASLLFYQALAHHRLLKKDDCLAAVSKLLEHEPQLPRRYVTLARLMEADIKPLKTDSLDEIARLMDDIRRRLTLARAGKVVRDQEDEVVKKLEKMIEDLEKQRQEQQQQKQQASSKGGRQPNNPLDDSRAAELKAPGEVDQKYIGKRDGWGNLPPKERQEVLQNIGRELPAHFRETIEEYFKRLAQDGTP